MKNLRRILGLWLLLFIGTNAPAGTLVQFHVFAGPFNYLGEVDVELYDQDKPVTVKNFIRLVQSGAYESGFFHRCQPGFVLQGGGFGVLNPFNTNPLAPPYSGLSLVQHFGQISNEFKVGTFRSNTNGTLAMAKSADPNSASSQFFFNLADNSPQLDNTNNAGGFTVFGHVIRGLEVVNQFNSLSFGNGIVNLVDSYGTNHPFTSLFYQLPNALLGTNPPPHSALILFDVNLLSLNISRNPTNGARLLSWETVDGVTNVLEYATNLPPAWQSLYSTNGNGFQTTVTDPSTNNTRRFYRLRVLF